MVVAYRWFIEVVCTISILCISGCALQQKKTPSSISSEQSTISSATLPMQAQEDTTAWQTQSILTSKQKSPYTALIFSPDNQFLVTCNQKGVIEVWNLQENALHRAWTVKDPIHAFTFAPDNTQLAATTQIASKVFDDKETTMYIWQWPSGNVMHTLHNPTGINFLRYTNEGKELITASRDTGLINVWNPNTGLLQRSLHLALNHLPLNNASDDENDYTVENITISPDGKYVASTHNHTYYPNYPEMNHENAYSYLNEVCVAIWDGADGKLLKKINTGLINYARYAKNNEIVFSPDGKYLATGHLGGELCTITMSDWSITKLEYYYNGSLAGQQILTFSPDSTYLAATNLEHKEFPDEKHDTVIWNVKTGELEKKYEQSNQITFSLSAKQFALCKKQHEQSPITIEIVSHA